MALQITLDAESITEALIAHIEDMGVDLTNKKVTSAFSAGRGSGTHTATVKIEKMKVTDNAVVETTTLKIVEDATAQAEIETPTLDLTGDVEQPADTELAFETN